MITNQPHRNRLWVWLIPVLLLSFWLGARMLDADAIWGDERNSIYDAGGAFYGPLSPVGNWERVATRNPWHAPGYFILLNGWGRLVGWDAPALRAFSLLTGLLAVAWLYRLGRLVAVARVGLIAAAMLATSGFYTHYLHELRMYALILTVVTFTLWAYLHVLDRQRPPAPLVWAGLLAGAVGLLYLHYLAALPLVAIGLYHLAVGGAKAWFAPYSAYLSPAQLTWRRWWRIVGVFGLAGVLFLPWTGNLIAGLGRAAEADALRARALDAPDALAHLVYLFSGGSIALLAGSLALTVFASFFAFTAYDVPQRVQRGMVRVWYFAAAMLVLILAVNEVVQIMHEGRLRYLILVWSPLTLFVAVGIGWQWGQRGTAGQVVASAIAVLWMALGVWASVDREFLNGLDGDGNIFPLNEIAAALESRTRDGDVIVNYVPDEGVSGLTYENTASYYFIPVPIEYLIVQGTRQADEALALLAPRERVWLAHMPDHVPENWATFLGSVKTTFTYCATVSQTQHLQLDLYAREAALCS